MPKLIIAIHLLFASFESITGIEMLGEGVKEGEGNLSDLRNFDLEDMEFESTNSNTTAKLPILKLAQENGTSVTKMFVPVTVEEKTNKKNDVKVRSLLLMALPNQHQLTFSQYPDAKTMFAAIETLFGGNEATKKTQKTRLKQQYENFNVTSAKSLDSIFNRLQKIVSRLEIFGVIIAQEDLNSNKLSSLPPEWNTYVVVWMNKPEVDTMSIDYLYNNFKIVEQKVKKSVGTSSDAQNLAFMTAPSTSSTNDANTAIPQVSTASPNVNTASPQVSTASFSDNVVYGFMVENPNGSNLLHQDLYQIYEDDLEAMDLKWECRAPRSKEGQFRNQDNTKKQGNNEDTFSKEMLAIDGVGFDWSDMAEEQCDDLIVKLNQTEFTTTTYKRGLATLKEQLITYGKNEVLFSEEVAVLKREVACKDYEINVLKSEFEKVKQEKEGIEFKIKKFDKASKDLDQFLGSQITDKSKKGLGYSAIPPPHPLIYNRPKKLDLSYSGLNEFKELEFKRYGPENSKQESNIVCDKKSDDSKENSDNSLVESVKPKNHEKPVKKSVTYAEMYRSQTPRGNQRNWNGQKSNQLGINTAKAQAVNTARPKTVKTARLNSAVVNAVRVNQANGKPQQDDTGFVDSGCSRHMTGNIAYLSDFKEFDGCYVTFGGGAHGLSLTKPLFMLHMDLFGPTFVSSLMHKKYCLVVTDDYSRFTWVFFLTTKDETSEILKNFIKEIENLVDKKVKIIRSDNGTEFKNKVMDDFCREKGIKREYSVARTPQQNGVAERRNRTLIEAARTMLADSKLPTTFWAEAVSTACYVQNRVLVVKPHNKTPYELFRGFKPALSFMRPFGCHVTILNTLDSLGKFDGKSDEGFFVGYSLSSKAFRVYNTRTRRVEENLHIGFLENKPMIEGNGPKWLFDIDSLTQSMNYVPVTAGTISNESAGTQGEFSAGTSEEIRQDCIVMPIWKDASYFDSPYKDVDNGEPKSAADDQKQDGDGPDNENDEQDKSDDVSSPKEVNVVGQHVNTASPDVNTGSSKLNTVDPSVNTASSYDQDSPKDMFTMGASHTLEATHVEFFSDEDEPEVDLGNITNSYTVPTTPNIRIHKDHPIENVIGDMKLSVQTRRMTKPTSEQGLNPQALLKLYLIHLGWKQCKKNFWNSNSNRFGYLWICLLERGPLEQNGSSKNKKDERRIVIRNKARFSDPDHPDKVYKVVKALYGLHQAPRACQDKYVVGILKKFNYTDVKSASTPVDLEKPLVKDGDADDVDVHLYRSMIGSLMYLTSSRPDIIYLKGKPTLGLWYSRDSPFELVSYTDSDYIGTTQDRKSTTRGCQFLGNRLISWQCKKQTLVATSTTEAEYVAATSCCGQNGKLPLQLLDLEAEQGHWSKDTILGDVDAQTRFETTSKQSNDLPFSRGYTLGSGEDSLKLLELMELCIIVKFVA
ncbi:putative ribonuclease H-like domain-containing protein [Tanacetum coccineum]